jgi:hypothetical protein
MTESKKVSASTFKVDPGILGFPFNSENLEA